MAYNRNIPQPTDLISNSQPSLLGNFQTIDSGTTAIGNGFARNHVTLTDGTNGGLHYRVDYYQNVTPPSISGFVSSLFPQTVSALSELSFTNSGGTTQITSGSQAIWKGGIGPGVIAANLAQTGSLVFPNGFAMIWGRSNSGTDSQAISFPSTGVPGWPANGFLTNCFQVQITPTAAGAATSASNVQYSAGFSKSGFTFRTTSGALNGFFWFAIGN